MSKIGRPTDMPKALTIKFRIDYKTNDMLNCCCKHTGKSKSEIIRNGIVKTFKEMIENENDTKGDGKL